MLLGGGVIAGCMHEGITVIVDMALSANRWRFVPLCKKSQKKLGPYIGGTESEIVAIATKTHDLPFIE